MLQARNTEVHPTIRRDRKVQGFPQIRVSNGDVAFPHFIQSILRQISIWRNLVAQSRHDFRAWLTGGGNPINRSIKRRATIPA
jgi:hypothetical protein